MMNGNGRKASVGLGLSLLFTAMVLLLVSCDTTSTNVNTSLLPGLEGREYVGMETCSGCHQEAVRKFALAPHGMRVIVGDRDRTCETCHGPGSLHVEGGGDKSKIVNPRDNPEMCFQCHIDKKVQFQMQYHHPVLEGHVSCADCHEIHEVATFAGATGLGTQSEICTKCHKEQKGPFVFAHEAMNQGCAPTCHSPHGSNYNKMLVADVSTLCLGCHWDMRVNTVGAGYNQPIGSSSHGTSRPMGRGYMCTDCHWEVHGSNTHKALEGS